MKHLSCYIIVAMAGCLLSACRHTHAPKDFIEATDTLSLYPDYTDITLPPNIAPCNFRINDDASEHVIILEELATSANKSGIVRFDPERWHATLQAHKGQTLLMHIYSHRPSGWVHHATNITVAEEDIDRYLSYRLIEPGYELYRQLGLYQRDLTGFAEEAIIENNREYSDEHNHCLNCHNYQAYDTRRMLFHVRGNHGGTMIIRDGKPEKIIIKHDSILSAGVYPTWHPRQDIVVFSTNKTGQVFHSYHQERIEVLDEASDLLLYDVERNEVSNILKTDDALETFPCWSPDGTRLFYCEAKAPRMPHDIPDSLHQQWLVGKYDSLFYDIKSMPFDTITRRFGAPRMEVCLSKSNGIATSYSAAVPRVSPDGRYLLYTRGRYGQFHIWHLDADLWVKDLQKDTCYALTATNSADADSYHTWSSNGRWIVFASRRDDSNYSRAFMAYFDRNGQGHKAFMLPQENPEHNIYRLRSYNVPELTRTPVLTKYKQLQWAIYEQQGTTVKYRGATEDASEMHQ